VTSCRLSDKPLSFLKPWDMNRIPYFLFSDEANPGTHPHPKSLI
jgi:hypothetical protein